MGTPKVTINEKFAALLRPLSPEEFAELEASCLKHGIREPLIVNEKGEILDGVHRFRISQKHGGIPFQVSIHAGLTEEETVTWIRLNQVGRRNCTEEEIAYQRGKLYESKKSKNIEKSPMGHFAPTVGDTAGTIAKDSGVSRDTVKRDAARSKLLDELPANVRDAYLAGTIKATDKELGKLSKLAPSDAQDVAREVRTGQKSMADALSGRKPAGKEEEEPEKPRTLKECVEPMVRTIDKLRQKTDDILDQFGPNPHAAQWLKFSDRARIELAHWMKAK